MEQLNLSGRLGCNVTRDQEFGPAIRCPQFDFTLTFEQSILGVGVSSIFLLLLPFKAYNLYGSSTKTLFTFIHALKIFISLLLVGVQTSCLALWVKAEISAVAIAAAVMSLICLSTVCGFAVFEHGRTFRPSTWICLYLLLSVAGDAVQLRTLYLRHYDNDISAITSSLLAGKLLLLIMESLPKELNGNQTISYSPEETTSVFGRSVFWWLNSLFWLGSRKILSLDDLYPLDHALYSKSLHSRMQVSWNKRQSPKPRALLYAVLSCLRYEILLTVLPRLAIIGFTYAQSFLIPAAINYLETPSNERNHNHAYGLLGAAALIYGGETFATAQYNLKMIRFQTAFRGSMVSLIYSKILTTGPEYKDAQPVTLMTTDVEQISQGFNGGLNLWALIIELAVGIWLLWRQLGASAIAPILLVLICTFSQGWAGKRMGPKQAAWVGAVQSRVGVASSILGSIKSIKMTGLVNTMSDLLQNKREEELKLARKFRWIMVLTTCIANIPGVFSAFVVFAAFSIEASLKHTAPLSTAKAFSSLTLVMLLASPAGRLLNSFPTAIAALGCLNRVQKFLLEDDFQDPRQIKEPTILVSSHDNIVAEEQNSKTSVVEVSDLVLKSDISGSPNTVSPIHFTMHRGEFTLVLGPVGSGKSTLSKAVLGAVSSYRGSTPAIGITSPSMAYCSQTPWIQNITIQQTIIGPNMYDHDWYLEVLWLCELEQDMSNMPDRDMSKIGSRGFNLSGGQKHRIALARAIYSRCPILILDDCISSLDTSTKRSIAVKLFSRHGYMKRHNCTVLLATHEESYVAYADKLLVLDSDGRPEYYGQPQQYSKLNIEIGNQATTDTTDATDTTYSPASQVSTPKKGAVPSILETGDEKAKSKEFSKNAKRQTGDITTWLYYAKAVGPGPLLVLAILVVVAALGANMPKLLLKWATEQNFSVEKFVGLFVLVTTVTWIGQNAMVAHMLIYVATRSAMSLHAILVKTVLNAPLSLFEKTDSGSLLNRFSQDMSLVDLAVPVSIFQVILSFSSVVAQAAFVCIGSSYMAIAVPIAGIVVYLIQRFYLRTSRQLRLLELEAKSPLYTKFSETMEGILTVRAFGWQGYFETDELQLLDNSQRPLYLLLCIQRWLSLVLGLTTTAIGVVVMALALFVPQSSSAGSLGVALTSVLGFNTALEAFITSYTGAETTIGAVTRTKNLEEETPPEDSKDTHQTPMDPGENWPRGDVRFSNVSVKYDNGKFGLRDVSLHVSEGRKLGIVGRTGSGKSTLLLTLLRLINPIQGSIEVDGQDIAKIPRNLV
ncbi:hypothetical protein BT63DRAFT_465330 [Microthyrium microscopicum]|uniref:P-loop containing nucleoside triphosphate hydrolase protein n=1 Tax=Microthyrium microscopicum TaxID=703497 RepID=A0A6A6TWX6_9PEZI|nr:hypothetical protein BT63DRAFT_465330 [Microthyrium microscopicum]